MTPHQFAQVHPARAELKKALYLTGAIVSTGGQVDRYTVLDRLRVGVDAG
jgi:hypothetical protein